MPPLDGANEESCDIKEEDDLMSTHIPHCSRTPNPSEPQLTTNNTSISQTLSPGKQAASSPLLKIWSCKVEVHRSHIGVAAATSPTHTFVIRNLTVYYQSQIRPSSEANRSKFRLPVASVIDVSVKFFLVFPLDQPYLFIISRLVESQHN